MIAAVIAILTILSPAEHGAPSSDQSHGGGTSQETAEKSAPRGTPDSLERRLDTWSQRGADIREVSARFTRAQHTRLMRKPMVSKGRFFWTQDAMRWTTVEPEPSELLVKGRTVELYYPSLKLLERYRLRERDMFWTALPGLTTSVKQVREDYDIRLEEPPAEAAKQDGAKNPPGSGEFVLKLVPKRERMAKYIRSIRVWTSESRYLPSRVEYVEREGDVVTLTFDEVRANAGLKPEVFRLDLPDDVEIVEPLDDIQ